MASHTFAARRLQRECKSMIEDPPEGIVAGPSSPGNMFEWSIFIAGPPGCVYEHGCFEGKLTFPKDYPMAPPVLRFSPPIWHPNVYWEGERAGEVCISILHNGRDATGYEADAERWSPVRSVSAVLLSVMSILAEPNAESPANCDAAKQMRDDPEGFHARAQAAVRRSLGLSGRAA